MCEQLSVTHILPDTSNMVSYATHKTVSRLVYDNLCKFSLTSAFAFYFR